MRRTAPVVCPTFHVERLDDDRVWPRLRGSLERLAEHGGRATAFVSPRSALNKGADLGERLQWIADEGHEIALHTHFRPGGADPKGSAPLSDDDIVASLEADYAYLVDRGHIPHGFCAGAWSIYPAAMAWIRAHGFRYDCSFRSFELKYDNPSAVAGDNHLRVSVVNGTLMIPTTATLRATLSRPIARHCVSLPYDRGTYALFYLHDYDLLSRGKEFAFRLLARRLRRSSVVPVQEVARAIGAADSRHDPPRAS